MLLTLLYYVIKKSVLVSSDVDPYPILFAKQDLGLK
jgi:hypothetical protein